MKNTVYLDTTIFSFLVENRKSLKTFTETTKDWWNTEKYKYDLFTSNAVIAELDDDFPNSEAALHKVEKIELLQENKEINEIANIYISNNLMPKDTEGDALHLAYSSFYKIDFLLTWNFNHLANGNKRQHIRNINTKLKLFTPDILTPFELFMEE